MAESDESTWVIDETQRVRVVKGPQAVAYFDGGPNETDQKGDYEFWTMESGRKGRVGRYLIGNDPAARFRRMRTERETKPGYDTAWHDAQSASLIRYATKKEVEKWLNDH